MLADFWITCRNGRAWCATSGISFNAERSPSKSFAPCTALSPNSPAAGAPAAATERRTSSLFYCFSTWPNSSSTGVARPKIETLTFMRPFSSSTSSTVPLKLVNGPSVTHLLAHLEHHRRTRALHPFPGLFEQPFGFGITDRSRPRAPAQEPGDFRRILHKVPGVVGQFHADQNVAREELALGLDFLAAAHLHHFLGRHQHVLDHVRKPLFGRLLFDLLSDLFFKPGIHVHHIPALGHISPFPIQMPPAKRERTKSPTTWSTTKKNVAASATMANTSAVVINVSRRVGQEILATSLRTSRMNLVGLSATLYCILRSAIQRADPACAAADLAGEEGLEPPTSGFGDRRSSQLSYTPSVRCVDC